MYDFQFSAGSSCVVRTEWRVLIRICEQIPRNLSLRGESLHSSAVIRHLLDLGHRMARKMYCESWHVYWSPRNG